jgi:hypothetical protein
MIAGDFESALAKFRSDATAEDLRQAIRNLETKFDRNQPRAPAGDPNGGQWVDTGRGGAPRPRKPPRTGPRLVARRVVQAASLLARNPEIAPLVQAVGLPAIAGGVALTRAIGDFDRQITGRQKTPFLNLPTEKLDLSITARKAPTAAGTSKRSKWSPRNSRRNSEIDDECEEVLRVDIVNCSMNASMYGRSRSESKAIAEVCRQTAYARYAECLKSGASGIRTPLFDGRRF